MILYMYIAPGQGTNFDVNRNVLSVHASVTSLKNNVFEAWFYTIFFMIYYMYIASGQGMKAPRDKILMSTGRPYQFTHLLRFKKNLFEVWFYTFFHDLIHVYGPGAGTENPQGTKFWCQQESLITLPICCKFQRNLYLFEVWFYTFFFMI